MAFLSSTGKVIRLSERDFARFLELISKAPPPTPALREAAEEYKRDRQQGPDGNW